MRDKWIIELEDEEVQKEEDQNQIDNDAENQL